MNETVVKSNFSLLPWLVPLVALLATVWLIYKNVNEAGVEIVVNFKNGSSLKEGKTFVKYKGFNVGKVIRLEIAEDINSVDAYIKLNHNVADLLAREGTNFWIVEPRISASEISGLDTIISGSYIEVRLKNDNKKDIKNLDKKYKFAGESFKPIKYYSDDGINIVLKGNSNLNIQRGTPVFYKKIETGKVIGSKLINDEVKIFVNIYTKYKGLVNSSTVFYKNGGLKLQAGLDGVDLELDSLASLISGGISFETLNENAKKISKGSEFKLYKDYSSIGLNEKPITFKISNVKGLKDNRTPIVYKGLKVGKILNIEDKGSYFKVNASIHKNYEKYLSDETKFYIVNADLENFEFKNIDRIIKGTYISFIPKIGNKKEEFNLYENYKKVQTDDMIKVRLRAEKFSNLNIGSEVYYKNVVIGRVLAQDFEKDFKELLIDVLIEKKYKKLLNDKTMFYIISSPLVETENLDIKVNFERVKPFVFGGIGLEYIPSNKKADNRYWLYDSYIDLKKDQKKYLSGHRIKVKLDDISIINENIDILYNGLKIGYVEEVNRFETIPSATLFINSKYKKFIKDYSKFYYENGLELSAGFDGIKFKMNSLSGLLKGSVVLSNKHKEIDSSTMGFKYMLYKDYDSIPFKRFKFTLISDDTYDLKDGSKIFYKGIEIGKIKKSMLDKDLNKVHLDAYLYDKYKKLSYGNPYFHILKPIISMDGIKDIQTLIKGRAVNLVPSQDKSIFAKEFILNESQPSASLYKKGKVFKLISKASIDLSIQSKVYYKKIVIGEVDKIYLSKNSQNTVANILIYDKYKNLVRENSIFYESSGIDVDISLLGADIKAETLNTILHGGVILYTPNEKKEAAKSNKKFTLKRVKEDKWKEYNPSINLY